VVMHCTLIEAFQPVVVVINKKIGLYILITTSYLHVQLYMILTYKLQIVKI